MKYKLHGETVLMTKNNTQFILKSLIENGYDYLIDKNLKNDHFLKYIIEKGYIKSNLNTTNLQELWRNCHGEQLNDEGILHITEYLNSVSRNT